MIVFCVQFLVAVEISVHRAIGNCPSTYMNSTWCQKWDFRNGMNQTSKRDGLLNNGQYLCSVKMVSLASYDQDYRQEKLTEGSEAIFPTGVCYRCVHLYQHYRCLHV